MGATESPTAHLEVPHIMIDIIGTGPDACRIQLIVKRSLEVVRPLAVAGHAHSHSHFWEYTARSDHLYVSSEYSGDQVTIYGAHTLKKVKTETMDVPAGIFSHSRARTVLMGLDCTRYFQNP